MRGNAGFTLVELLVGMAITGILLALLGNFLIESARTVAVADVRSEALAEVTLTQQLIASRIRQAWWVAPPNSTMRIPDFRAQNPTGGGGFDWTVAGGANTTLTSHHILILILPPGSSPHLPALNNQYQLYAFYPVQRAALTAGYAATNPNHPERPANDPGNPGTWVLMQYRATVGTDPPTLPAGSVNVNTAGLTFTNENISTVMEYQRPLTSGLPLMFAHRIVGGASQTISVNLQASRNLRGQNILHPRAPLSLTVQPRNLGR